MKKLSDRYKRTLLFRSRRSVKVSKSRRAKRQPKQVHYNSQTTVFQPFVAKAWDGNEEQEVLCMKQPISPPHHINFDDYIEETLSFLQAVRDKIGRKRLEGATRPTWIKVKQGRIPRIHGFYDYSQISSISISAALVVAACYDRAARISGKAPPAINYPQWPQSVFRVLFDVGFFEFIGHIKSEDSDLCRHRGNDGSGKIMSAISGKNANGLEECSGEIFNLLKFLSFKDDAAEVILADVNSAISEAMINVARHAYPDDFVQESEYDTVNQWWMTAQADRENRTLTIVVYDQGATIPGTLPRREWFKRAVEGAMRQVIPDFSYSSERRARDHEFINYSVKEGKTQTGDHQRGLGLPQMQSLIDLCDDGSLTIVSRAGLYKYGKNTGVHKRALPTELEGTLIEWHLSLPEGASLDG